MAAISQSTLRVRVKNAVAAAAAVVVAVAVDRVVTTVAAAVAVVAAVAVTNRWDFSTRPGIFPGLFFYRRASATRGQARFQQPPILVADPSGLCGLARHSGAPNP